MGLFAYIIVGLIAGLLAKALMPGSKSEPASFIGTILLGIVGAVVGGLIWNLAFGRSGATSIDIRSVFVALVGSCVMLAAMRLANRSAS